MTQAAQIWQSCGAVEPLHVVDVGANPIEGDAPYRALLDAGYCRVTGFEPQEAALEALNARRSGAETYLPHALGDGGAARLRLFKHSGFTSVYPPDRSSAALLGYKGAMRLLDEVPVATARLDDLDEVGAIDFLKIDVQGSELPVIANGRGKLAQAAAVQTEIRFLPLYEGEPSFGELDAELRAQGFMFHDFAALKHVHLRCRQKKRLRRRAFRQVVDGDAIYIRDLRRIGDVSDRQLIALALLADAVFASHDLAVFCLDALAQRGVIAEAAVEGYIAALPAQLRTA